LPGRHFNGRKITAEMDGSAVMMYEDGSVPGANPGIYLVKISKMVNGQETIPPKFNEQSVIGYEVQSQLANP